MNNYVPSAKLIQLVKQESAIYDPSHHQHRDKDYMNQAWVRIAKELNSTAFVCKTKWNNLRSNYTRELRRESLKLLEEQPDDSLATPNKWPFYPMLRFLNPFLRTKASILEKMPPVSGSEHLLLLHGLKEESQSSCSDDELHIQLDLESEKVEGACSGPHGYTNTNSNSDPHGMRMVGFGSAGEQESDSWSTYSHTHMPQAEAEARHRQFADDYSSATVNSTTPVDLILDSDKLFLLSLLPLMKQLSPADNLGFRLETQKILQQKLFPS